jgi:uncharacterized BrkB/YihY/UPF0761 family membrane protein
MKARIIIGMMAIGIISSVGIIAHLKPNWLLGENVVLNPIDSGLLNICVVFTIVVSSLYMFCPTNKNIKNNKDGK